MLQRFNQIIDYLKVGIKIPLAILFTFYLYFGITINYIYDNYQIGLSASFLLPRIFIKSFLLFLIYSIILAILSYWKRIYNSLLLFIFPLTIIYLLQLFSLFYSGNFIINEAIQEFNAVGIYFNIRNIFVVLAFLLYSVLLYLTLRRRNKTYHISKRLIVDFIITILLFTVAFAGYYSFQRATKNYASSFPSPKTPPEIAFVEALFPQPISSKPIFSIKELELLKTKYGISFSNSEYPYQKNYIYKDELNYVNTDTTKQPNVIIFFVESFSARFLTPYNSQFNSITPNIDTFAKQSLVVSNYYNHTIPTINGLIGQLCSIYPYFINKDFEDKSHNFKIVSLIDILNNQGYKSSMICYENNAFSMLPVMRNLGFQNLYFKTDIETAMNLKSTRKDYLSDKDLFDFYITKLLDKRSTQEPFIDVISTIDTHTGYEIPSYSKHYNDGKVSFLNAVNNFDYLWGQFWEKFSNSDLSKNTIVILTADHCLPYSSGNKNLYPANNLPNPMFDKIPLIIYSPLKKLPSALSAQATSISLAPTILQLLDINNVTNSFMGESIFEKDTMQRTIGLYSSQIYGKSRYSKYFDLSNDTLISKWSIMNRFVIENNKISNTKR